MNRREFLTRFLCSQNLDFSAEDVSASTSHKQAAVLIALVQRNNGLHIILTERALHLRHHPGQVSFPGGKKEHHDANLQQTAIRETFEEIGLATQHIDIIGQLPARCTSSGFEVFPFVAFVDAQSPLHIDAQEVKSVFELPLHFLLDNTNFYYQPLLASKKRNFTYCMSYQNHLIWGATALMLKNLQCMLRDDVFSAFPR